MAKVEVNSSSAVIVIDGSAAASLYYDMTQVDSTPIEDGQVSGFVRAGENYTCTRLDGGNGWQTRCYIHVSQIETGVVGKAND